MPALSVTTRPVLTLLLAVILSAQVLADSEPVLPIALINDSEDVFADYSAERNLGFRLGLEFGTEGTDVRNGWRIELAEYVLDPELWEANLLPGADQLPSEPVWLTPVQARKAHRVIQYAGYLDHLALVAATPANNLPVADESLAFRTFYRWQDVEQALLDWTHGESRLWVTAVNSSLELPAAMRLIEVSPRSSGASVVEDISSESALRNGGRLTNSWPVLLDWLDVLEREAGLAPEQITTWLPDIAGLVALRDHPGLYGVAYYYYDLPDSAANDWLVRTMLEREDRLPSHYVVAGMNSALALLAALDEQDPEAALDAATLADILADLEWQGVQGAMSFDAQGEARQSLFLTRLRQQPQLDWARPVLIEGGRVSTRPD
ncbi:hypothetical protein E4656_16690 [Natronospirillum operosum]|uniref:Leucine-binding protein domain-containing protein n=1 Tax=Natronospirillum operosum TaxID=2759953 RepID=A0A4Z0WB90_9GAMM|nr:ABC transporter substrate-binding protein [Natronospirillum operosum]TGG91356.1 hypothetical protein E4656_16690 [Natronospirillum operosum]